VAGVPREAETRTTGPGGVAVRAEIGVLLPRCDENVMNHPSPYRQIPPND
jgi:hypothetical protein